MPKDSMSGEGFLAGLQMVMFLIDTHMAERKRGRGIIFLKSFIIRTLIILMRVPPLWPNCLQKSPLLNIIIFGIKLSTYEFRGDKNIQSIIMKMTGIHKLGRVPIIGGGIKYIGRHERFKEPPTPRYSWNSQCASFFVVKSWCLCLL